MKIQKTRNYGLIRRLCGKDAEFLPPRRLWKYAVGITNLVVVDEGVPKMLAVLVEPKDGKEPEVHIQLPPQPWKKTIPACELVRDWIKQNRSWERVHSWTEAGDTRTFEFAKYLGFREEAEADGRKMIVLDLKEPCPT